MSAIDDVKESAVRLAKHRADAELSVALSRWWGILTRQGVEDFDLAARGRKSLKLNDALDLIVLQVLGMGENDEFAEQTQGEYLQAEHDQQGGKQQRWPVRQRLMKKQPLTRHDLY